MIIGKGWDHWDFFLQIDAVCQSEDKYWTYGTFNFWIDDIPYPGNGVNITFNSTPWCIVQDYQESLAYEYPASNLPLDKIDFDAEDDYSDENFKHHLFNCDFAELQYQCGLRVKFEIVGETLRFFYSQNESPWQLKEIPLAYYDYLMKKLNQLIKECFKPLLENRFNEIDG